MKRLQQCVARMGLMAMIGLIGACTPPGGVPIDPTISGPPDNSGTLDTGGSGTLDPGGSDDAGPGPGDNGAEPDPGGGGADSGKLAVTGRLALSSTPSGRAIFGSNPAGREIQSTTGCEVVAVSQATEKTYRGLVDEDGSFAIELPESERGNTFMLTVLAPDGKPIGPVLLGVAGENGLTGLQPAGEVDLGTIEIPQNVLDAGLVIGEDADLSTAQLDPDAQARLDENGVPVGVESFGKGDEAQLDPAELAVGTLDADMDGLIDMFDADSNGSGIVDDFEPGASSWAVADGLDHRPNFFTNLKIPIEDAAVYYNGSEDEIAAALSRDVVITFDVVMNDDATRAITECRLLDSPAPAYLPAGELAEGPGTLGGTALLWSSVGYAFTQKPDRWDAFLVPNAVMSPGDTFRVEVTMSDGEKYTHTRMINFIFKRIPRLVSYGSAGAMKNYDPNSDTERGHGDKLLRFDGSQDLVLTFRPPEDEDGNPLTRLGYFFSMFPHVAGGGQYGPIDVAATWPPMPFFGSFGGFELPPGELTLADDGTYTFALPKDFFVDKVVLMDGSTRDIELYQVDIAAWCPSGNASVGFFLEKE